MNLPTILIAAVIAAIFIAIIVQGIRSRKRGSGGCGCGCAGCPNAGMCHPQGQSQAKKGA